VKKILFSLLVLISIVFLIIRFGFEPLSGFLNLKPKAGIRVLSTPEEASVILDGISVGKTPFEDSNLENREYAVMVSTPEATWSGKVKLDGGTLTVINRDLASDNTASAGEILTLEKGKGATVISNPPSSVEVDGKVYGQTPILVNIGSGEHTFVLSKDGFLKRSIKALVPEGFNLTLNVDLSLAEADARGFSPKIQTTPILIVRPTPTGFLRVRDKPSVGGLEVALVKPGDELTLIEELPSWDKIRTTDGKVGYVSSVYVTKK
jgi:hypothetical protein